MTLNGTVVNGVLVFDGPPPPDGTRLRAVPAADPADDEWDELDDLPPPPSTETRAEFLQSLRDEYARVQAGEGGMSVEDAFAQVDAEIRRVAEENGK